MLFLVHMRADLLQVLRKSATQSETPILRSLDASLKVSKHFDVGFETNPCLSSVVRLCIAIFGVMV